MAINITGKFKPQGNFALIDAADVEMPNGSRLSDNFSTEPPKDGNDGKDGVSATHSWNGTILTITSSTKQTPTSSTTTMLSRANG
jgi:hypothetical protein